MTSFEPLPTVIVARETSIDRAAIWAVLSDLGALHEWAPGIENAAVTTDEAEGVGVVRNVKTAQFGEIQHHFTTWADQEIMAYETADSGPFARTLTTYTLQPTDGAGASVIVSLAFEVKPGAIEQSQAEAILNKGLGATLEALEKRAQSLELSS